MHNSEIPLLAELRIRATILCNGELYTLYLFQWSFIWKLEEWNTTETGNSFCFHETDLKHLQKQAKLVIFFHHFSVMRFLLLPADS